MLLSEQQSNDLIAGVQAGNRAAIAQALNLLDSHRPTKSELARDLMSTLSQRAFSAQSALIGITGPPGVGKSTLICALIEQWRIAGLSVGVLAVDPSSKKSGGALLGDRLRIRTARDDDAVFIRSLASRSELGGLSPEIWPMCVLMMSVFDRVLIETVGIGQSETDIGSLADSTCFVAQPASGDSIQFLKAGIMEIPDVVAVNKSDLGLSAVQTGNALQAALSSYQVQQDWTVPTCLISASRGEGVVELVDSLEAHRGYLVRKNSLIEARKRRAGEWVVKRLQEEFGSAGLQLLGGATQIITSIYNAGMDFFLRLHQMRLQLHEQFNSRLLTP